MLTQFNKSNYVLHFKILQFYLQQGMKILKFHHGISYHQSAFFSAYIDSNSHKCQATDDELQQDYYKLKNNSLYGKTMENLCDCMNFQLVNDEVKHCHLYSHGNFVSSIYYTPDLVGVNCAAHEVHLCKLIYIG